MYPGIDLVVKADDGRSNTSSYVNGEEVSVFQLKKGMNLTATIVTTTPTTVASQQRNISGTAPAVAKVETPPQQDAILIDEKPTKPAPVAVTSNEAPASTPEPQPTQLPKTGSSVPGWRCLLPDLRTNPPTLCVDASFGGSKDQCSSEFRKERK